MHTSGTAANYLDLMDKFVTFVTSGLTAGQNWTVLRDTNTGATDTVDTGYDRIVQFQAPGLAGTDEIYMSMAAYHSTSSDIYNIGFWGATGYTSGVSFANQAGASPGTGAWLLLWNQTIPYWFVANGRCAKIVAKVASTYEHAYIGFITPYATPAEYPYPLLIGGSQSNGNQRYSDIEQPHSAYWNPGTYSSQSQDYGTGSTSGCFLRAPSAIWNSAGNLNSNQNYTNQGLNTWPYGAFENIGPNYGTATDVTLYPIILHNSQYSPATYGELDGVYFVSGFGQASENIVTINDENYLIVQNTWRTGGPGGGQSNGQCDSQYAAIALTTD